MKYSVAISADKSEISIHWDGKEIDPSPVQNRHAPSIEKNSEGLPTKPDVRQIVAKWIADQSVPDEQQMQIAIKRLADLEANNFDVEWLDE